MPVVIGYVPDKYGDAALAAGLAEARLRGTGVVVVNSTKGDAFVDERYLGTAERAVLEQSLATSGVDHEIRQTMGRDVADEILQVARDRSADVIVLGLRHRTPVGKLLMGSVAQRVILEAACPVIAVKA
jgi:nucleotide-binding universal stress UspA family protein